MKSLFESLLDNDLVSKVNKKPILVGLLKDILNCKNDYQLRHILTSFLKYGIEDINSVINEIDFIITLEQLHLIN